MTEDDDLAATVPRTEPPTPLAMTVAAPQVQARSDLPSTAPFRVRYRSDDVIGRGGMGIVRACHDSVIGRDVALKESLGDESRFLREARVQAQLEHPSIVPVYDLGVEDGKPYFTMKRIRGRTLDEIAPSTPRPRLLAYFASVCLAVDFAHTKGVIHRDLKPSNVMVGDFGEVYVLDWGIAKLWSDESSGRSLPPPALDSKATATGDLVGTPAYLAPEQAGGGKITPRTDVFALGAILYELLTGQMLNEGRSAPDAVAHALRPMNARASVRAPAADVPPELEAICVKATALDPSARYESVRDLHTALQAYLDGDRDVERRRLLAAEEATRAESLATAALEATDEGEKEREEAMRALGRALALDQHNELALTTFVRLATKPPRRLPAAVKTEIRDAQREAGRVAGRAWAFGALLLLTLVPVTAILGVRDWASFAVTAGLVVASGLFAFLAGRPSRAERPLWVASVVASSVFIGFLSRMFGPFVAAPLIALGASASVVFHPYVRGALWGPLVGASTIAVPFLLEQVGVLEPSYQVGTDGIRIVPHMVALPPGFVLWYLLLTSCAAIAFFGLYLARVRRTLEEAQEQIVLQRWVIERMLPRGVITRKRKAAVGGA